MDKSGRLFDRLAMSADLPDEPFPGRALVEIIDNRRVLIENHRGVSEYSTTLVRVKVKFGSVCVCGSKLELTRMSKGQLVISGIIEAVRLNRG